MFVINCKELNRAKVTITINQLFFAEKVFNIILNTHIGTSV